MYFTAVLNTNIGRGCGGKMFNIDGTIVSPMYPMAYNKNSTCRWDIAVPRPHPITIHFRGVYTKYFVNILLFNLLLLYTNI